MAGHNGKHCSTSEIIMLTRQQGGWDVGLNCLAQFPNANSPFSKETRDSKSRFLGIVDGIVIVGHGKSVHPIYQYDLEEDIWLNLICHEALFHGSPRNCKILDKYLLCGVLGSNTELIYIQPNLSQVNGRHNGNFASSISTHGTLNSCTTHEPEILIPSSEKMGIKKIDIAEINNEHLNTDVTLMEDPAISKKYQSVPEGCGGDPVNLTVLQFYSHYDRHRFPNSCRGKQTHVLCYDSLGRIPSPIGLRDFTITKIGCTKLILIGGVNVPSHPYQSNSRSNPSSTKRTTLPSHNTFLGEVNIDKMDVSWKKLDPMKKGRCMHITFKMKDNIYVVGGLVVGKTVVSCCERYSLTMNRWFPTKYQLPYPLCNASVVVTSDELFAVITGGEDQNRKATNKIIVFDEANGFKLLEYTMQRRRSKHVSICIPS